MVSSNAVSDIRAEEGNLRYAYFFPMDDPETVLLIDQWKDQASLDGHHKSEMMGKMLASVKNTVFVCGSNDSTA